MFCQKPLGRTAAETRAVVDAAASHSLSRNNPWHGHTLRGQVVATFLRSRATVLDGKVIS